MTTASRVLCAFGDDRSALVMDVAETTLAAQAPGAEQLDVVDGAIVGVRIVFDRLPFEHARHRT